MNSNTEHLDWTVQEVKNYLARFRSWCTTQGELTDEKKNAHFLGSVGKEAYDLIQTITFSREPASVRHKGLLDTILDHFKPANFVAAERDRFPPLCAILMRKHKSLSCGFRHKQQNVTLGTAWTVLFETF